MKVAAALFTVGFGLTLAAAGLILADQPPLPRGFAAPLVAAAMLAWTVAGGLLLANSGRGDYKARHNGG